MHRRAAIRRDTIPQKEGEVLRNHMFLESGDVLCPKRKSDGTSSPSRHGRNPSLNRHTLYISLLLLLWRTCDSVRCFTLPPSPDLVEVSVLDGDTIEVLHNQRPVRIRLYGIDSPGKYNHFPHLGPCAFIRNLQVARLLWLAAHDAFGCAASFFSSGFMSRPRTLKDVSRSVLSKLACAVILSPLRPYSVGVATISHNAIVKTSAARWKMPRPIFHPDEDPLIILKQCPLGFHRRSLHWTSEPPAVQLLHHATSPRV